MKRFYLSLVALLSFTYSEAQISQKVIAEHFTNTKCSVCASRNPGLIQNFVSNPDVLHISIHPSSPYATCIFNQHNKTENDDRTKYYGLYGSTPRLAINGNVQASSVNFGSSTLFTSYKGKL